MRIRINPYNSASRSAAALAQYLSGKHNRAVLRLRRNTQFRPRRGDAIINYGIGHVQIPAAGQLELNTSDAVRLATNKLTFFREAEHEQYRTPGFTTDIDEAREWIQEGEKVCCRTNLTGHSADGLVLAETEEQLVRAPLYTKYVPKNQEYRVHFVHNTIVDVQRKARRMEVPDEEVNWQVRNHDNGFIYARNNVRPNNVPRDVLRQCQLYIEGTSLDFGSIDVIFSDRLREAYILEVNTASGLEGTTLERIGDALYALVTGDRPTPWVDLQPAQEEQPEEAPVEPEPEEEVAPPVLPEHVQRELENDLMLLQRGQQAYEQYVQAQRAYEDIRGQVFEVKWKYGTHVAQHAIVRIRERLENPQLAQAAPNPDVQNELQVLL